MLKIHMAKLIEQIELLKDLRSAYCDQDYEEEMIVGVIGLLNSIINSIKKDNVCVLQGISIKEAVGELLSELPKARVDKDLKIPLIRGIRAATNISLKDAQMMIEDHVEFRPNPFCKPVTKRYPSEWEEFTGIKILDPDGWRFDNRPWDVPIDEAEWVMRMSRSTVMNKKRSKE